MQDPIIELIKISKCPICNRGPIYCDCWVEDLEQKDNKGQAMEWINCNVEQPPKKGKFLFSYHFGIGLGDWSYSYKEDKETYILILWASGIANETQEPFHWSEEKMIEMEVSWKPLPMQPERLSGKTP